MSKEIYINRGSLHLLEMLRKEICLYQSVWRKEKDIWGRKLIFMEVYGRREIGIFGEARKKRIDMQEVVWSKEVHIQGVVGRKEIYVY